MAAIGKKATLTRQVPYTAHCKPYVSVCLSGPYTFLCRYPIRSSDFPGDISPDPLCDCHSCVYWTYSDPKSEPTSELSPVWVIHVIPTIPACSVRPAYPVIVESVLSIEIEPVVGDD